MDPEYIRLVLEPVVQYLEMGRWPEASSPSESAVIKALTSFPLSALDNP